MDLENEVRGFLSSQNFRSKIFIRWTIILRTFSVSGSFLLGLQAGDRLPRPVQHFGAYLHPSGGGARGWRAGGPGSAPTTRSRAQLQRGARVIRAPATRAALRHSRLLNTRSCSVRVSALDQSY